VSFKIRVARQAQRSAASRRRYEGSLAAMALTGIGIESYNFPLLDGRATQPNERSDSVNAAGEAVPDAPGGGDSESPGRPRPRRNGVSAVIAGRSRANGRARTRKRRKPGPRGPRRADTACDPHRVVDEKIRRRPGVRPILAALDAANGVKSDPRELLVREILGVVQRTQRCEKTCDVLPQREFADRLSGNDEMFLRRRSGRRPNLPEAHDEKHRRDGERFHVRRVVGMRRNQTDRSVLLNLGFNATRRSPPGNIAQGRRVRVE
jgi:hypothetical protein